MNVLKNLTKNQKIILVLASPIALFALTMAVTVVCAIGYAAAEDVASNGLMGPIDTLSAAVKSLF